MILRFYILFKTSILPKELVASVFCYCYLLLRDIFLFYPSSCIYLQKHTCKPGFHVGADHPNPYTRACEAGALPTGPCVQVQIP